MRNNVYLIEEIKCREPSNHCLSEELIIFWSINHGVLHYVGLFSSCAWFGLVLRIWNVCLLSCSCEKFGDFWNVSLFTIYVLGRNVLVRPIYFDQFSTCTIKWFDTPRAYTDCKFVLAQICLVMGFGNNYLC